MSGQEKFPDGTPIPDWFRQNEIVNIDTLGKEVYHYRLRCGKRQYNPANGENTGRHRPGSREWRRRYHHPQRNIPQRSIFFKPKTHLYMEEGAVLKGSDDISNFAIVNTRIEGQSLKYFAALVNADKVNGFTISGKGTINGNGHRYWKSFWLRRQVIPKCTNMDELRPRLVYISNSNDVQISGVRLMNSPFWTTHIYRCNNIKLLNLHIFAPAAPVKAPSSDAIDIDVCSNVLVKNCYMSVNDDAVALKGGKGPWADKDPNNGSNTNIIIEVLHITGFCHSVCMRQRVDTQPQHHSPPLQNQQCHAPVVAEDASHTPQHYEYILVEDITGDAKSMLLIKPWTQFFDLKGRKDIPLSRANNVTLRNISLSCDIFFNVRKSDQYELKDFTFENLNIKQKCPNAIKRLSLILNGRR